MNTALVTTYILPDQRWAGLLPLIAQDAKPGAVIEVHTEDMQALAEQALHALGREDISVRLRPSSAAKA